MSYCVVFGCKNRIVFKNYAERELEERENKKFSFHLFPQNIERRNKWLEILNLQNYNLGKRAAVCSAHFREEDYEPEHSLRKLKKDAIPYFSFIPTDDRRMENSKTGEGTLSNQAPPRGERKSSRGSRQKAVDNLSKKFLRNFDPEHSEREKRKLYRRLYQSYRKHLYNDVGIFIRTSDDLCDCLSLDCPGCHFPCPKCASPKCAHDCRNNRKWTYDVIHREGTDPVIKNPLLKESETK